MREHLRSRLPRLTFRGQIVHIRQKMCAWDGLDERQTAVIEKVLAGKDVVSAFPPARIL